MRGPHHFWIYPKTRGLDFSLSSVGIKAAGRTSILRLNYHNTREILQFACDFASTFLDAKGEGTVADHGFGEERVYGETGSDEGSELRCCLAVPSRSETTQDLTWRNLMSQRLDSGGVIPHPRLGDSQRLRVCAWKSGNENLSIQPEARCCAGSMPAAA